MLDIWNGANSLIISVDENGQLPPHIDKLLAARDVECVYVHERIGPMERSDLAHRFGTKLTRLWAEAFGFELHPLNLQPSVRDPSLQGPRLVLPIPVYEDEQLLRLSRIVFGRIDDDARSAYQKGFVLEEGEGASAHIALVETQISSLSPLGQSTYLMRIYQQTWPLSARQLVFLDGSDFDALLGFWNLRARATGVGEGPAVVAAPVQALDNTEVLSSLRDWTSGDLRVLKPDVLVVAHSQHRAGVASALETLGYRPAEGDRLTEYSGQVPEDRRPLEYRFIDDSGLIGGRLRRGVWNEDLITLELGRNVVRFETGRFATATWGGQVRLDLLSWPLPFKPTGATARRVHQNACVDQDVVYLKTSATNSPLTFDLAVPGSNVLLEDFLAERGLSSRLSAAGGYARALIGRLGGPQRLEALARPETQSILEPLTSRSRPKLMQRIAVVLREHYPDAAPSSTDLAEMLRREVMALEAPARSLNDLAGTTGTPRADLLRALEPLVDGGFVLRGRSARCPECGYKDFYPLHELDERLTCHACQQLFLLQIAAGQDEPRLSYQLDALMARAMDQDMLPVLLTLYYLDLIEGTVASEFWPGLEIQHLDGPSQDCDLLFAQDGTVTICECKRSAPNLSLEQAKATLALAERLEARTVFAAIKGEFSDAIRSLGEPPGLQLLTGAQLVRPHQ